MSKNVNGTDYTTFQDLWNDPKFVSREEKEKIEFQVRLIGMLVEAREAKGLTQAQLAELSGVKQPAIARLESMGATPKIDTLFRLLKPLGYTLAIVPDDKKGHAEHTET